MAANIGEEQMNSVPKDDGTLAMAILIAAVVIVIIGAIYLWRSRSSSGSDHSWKQNSFTPPPERAEFIAAKERLDVSKVSQLDELKKLLMRRAIQTIPILLSLQNEGTSIERLYKRGMLTDDMHFKVKELKAFVDKEFQDIQYEADDLLEGWGQHIWSQAMQFHQMIQKQAESKNEEQKAAEAEKKKQEAQKRKDAEKAKKQLTGTGSSGNLVETTKASAAAPSSSSGAGATGTSAGGSTAASAVAPVISAADAEAAKVAQAEKMARQLLEEEEKERAKGGSAKKGGKK